MRTLLRDSLHVSEYRPAGTRATDRVYTDGVGNSGNQSKGPVGAQSRPRRALGADSTHCGGSRGGGRNRRTRPTETLRGKPFALVASSVQEAFHFGDQAHHLKPGLLQYTP
jgi:hypothetical protein